MNDDTNDKVVDGKRRRTWECGGDAVVDLFSVVVVVVVVVVVIVVVVLLRWRFFLLLLLLQQSLFSPSCSRSDSTAERIAFEAEKVDSCSIVEASLDGMLLSLGWGDRLRCWAVSSTTRLVVVVELLLLMFIEVLVLVVCVLWDRSKDAAAAAAAGDDDDAPGGAGEERALKAAVMVVDLSAELA